MKKQPANMHWLQNNNNSPQRQQNQMRPGPGGSPNGQRPRGSSSINRWLLIIVALMLGIYLYQYFSSSNSSTPQRAELTYSDFYTQINAGNIKTATIIGQTDIQGVLCTPVNGNTQYHVVQLPNGDPNLTPALLKEKPTCASSVTIATQGP